MSVTVTLHVYSGVPDPAWELSDAQVSEFVERLKSIDQPTLVKPPGMVGGLGYRGFSVSSVREPDLDSHVYLHSGIVDFDRFAVNRLADDSSVESWLLSTAPAVVDDELRRFVQSQLVSSPRDALSKIAPSTERRADAPPYDPGKWNNDSNIRAHNNCYNYANDKITNTFAQPGRGSGQMFTSLDCGNVSVAAVRDGQKNSGAPAASPAQGQYVALVIWPGRDYHWYRQDVNGMWSHKPGQTPARNTDNSGRPISDPRNCDRGPYSQVCGFFLSVPANTRIS